MGKFDPIIQKYSQSGVSTDNIDYAISAVKDGSKRDHIIENLTADYRGMTHEQATALLAELFAANGGEFKKENRGGYIYAAFFFIMGGGCAFYIFYVFVYGGVLVRPILVSIGAIVGIGGGLVYLITSLLGKYRDKHEPFKE